MKKFDRKFGREFLAALPAAPGVYRVYDSGNQLIYVGKAKNLRRRLSQYRNAKRRKKHLKMRSIVGDAERIEYEVCTDHLEACLLEAKLIQDKRPKWNVAGAFYFLYPMIGMKHEMGCLYFCLTNQPEQYVGYEFHGAFRSRDVTGEAFFSLMKLMALVGHPVPRKKLGQEAWRKFSYVFAFRQIPESWLGLWARYWRGESTEALEQLVLCLVENAHARRRPREIQEHLNSLKLFWRHEAAKLKQVTRALGYGAYPVPQKERDLLFLRYRLEREARAAPARDARA